jgi:hypothetical protein
MGELLTLLLVALVGGVVGAWATSYFQARRERQRELDREAFRLFERLVLLRDVHWGATVLEFAGHPLIPEEVERYNRLSWEVADLLRCIDRIPEAEDVLRAMWSLDFGREQDRNDALSAVLERLGRRLNPKYHDVVRELGDESRKLMVSDFDEYQRRRRWIFPWPGDRRPKAESRSYSLAEIESGGRTAIWSGPDEEFMFSQDGFLWHPWESSQGVHVSTSWRDVPTGKELPQEGWHHLKGCDCSACRELW